MAERHDEWTTGGGKPRALPQPAWGRVRGLPPPVVPPLIHHGNRLTDRLDVVQDFIVIFGLGS